MSDVRNKPCMSHYPDFDHHCASKGQGCEYYEPRSLMIKFDWFEDSWNDIETEDGEILDTNLWTCDTSEKQYISFYRTFTNDKGYRETKATKPIATYRVIKEGKPE